MDQLKAIAREKWKLTVKERLIQQERVYFSQLALYAPGITRLDCLEVVHELITEGFCAKAEGKNGAVVLVLKTPEVKCG
jgi:hypothetical protein